MKYYQPHNVDMPKELYSFVVFKTRENASKWLKCHGYSESEFPINEYQDGDIEDPVFLDEDDDTFNNDNELKADVKFAIRCMFADWESDEVEKITDLISNEVEEDVIECADYDYNDSDIRIAVKRVIMAKMGLEC